MRRFALILISLILCMLPAAHAPAQSSAGVVVDLAADRHSMYAGDSTLVHVIILNAENAPAPTLEVPATFTVEALPRQDSSSTFITMVNGRRTERREVRYLYPFRITSTQAGQHVIGPARITIDGNEHVTGTIPLAVRDAQQRDDMRLLMALDTETAYVGEPVTLTLIWMIRNNVRGFEFSMPAIAGAFDVYDAPAPTPTPQDIRNQRYFEVDFLGSTVMAERGSTLRDDQTWTTLTLQKTLIPRRTGTIEIRPAIVRCDVQTGRGRQGLFGDQGVFERAVAPSNSATLHVQPLPDSTPPEFTGLVGAYQVSARLSQSRMKVGDPVKLTVRVNGSHPIERAANLDLLRGSSIEKSFQLSTDDLRTRVEGGSLILETTIRPISEHVTELPELRVPYFDPELGQYVVARSEPQRITVEPTRIVTIDDALGAERPGGGAIESVEGGLAHVYTTPDVLIDQRIDFDAFLGNRVILGAILGPPALWAAAAITLAARRRVRRDSNRNTKRIAASQAKQRIGAADAIDQIGAAMRTYLKQRFDAPSSVSPMEAEALITTYDEATAERTRALFDRMDEAQFAGAGQPLEELKREALELVAAIERAAGKGAS